MSRIVRDPSAPLDAVRVMTVHGSEGAPSPVVILAEPASIRRAAKTANAQLPGSATEVARGCQSSAPQGRDVRGRRKSQIELKDKLERQGMGGCSTSR
jgi:ATP-dependent exoDNAse (exonuclease V) beta subunit